MGQRSLVVVVLVVAALVAPATVASARPPALVCGQVITTDVVLRTDLTCAGDGLVIGASGVTIRLGHHTITSVDGTGAGIRLGEPAAGQPPGCVADVRILGGSIAGFFAGVWGGGCYPDVRSQVSNMTLTGNTWGAYLNGGATLGIDRTTIVGPNGIGGPFRVATPTGTAEVTRSTIEVTSPDGYSILDAFGPPSTFDSSRLTGGRTYSIANGNLDITASRLTDVLVGCSDADVRISSSVLTRSPTWRTSVCGFDLVDNRFVGPGSGIAFTAANTTFGARFTGNTFTGWDTAVAVAAWGDVTVTGNTFHHNGTAISCTTGPCRGTISGNTIRDNRGTGVLLTTGTWHVGSNTAVRNGGLAILAEGPGLTVVDDGGNVARRNQPPQCVGVVCTPH